MNFLKIIFIAVAFLFAVEKAGAAEAIADPGIGSYAYFVALDQRCPEKDVGRDVALAEYKALVAGGTRQTEKNGPRADQLARFDPWFARMNREQIGILCRFARKDIYSHVMVVQALVRAKLQAQAPNGNGGNENDERAHHVELSYEDNLSAAENSPANEPPISTNEQVISIPAYPFPPVQLQVTILKPDGAGPFPLVILNHGSVGSIKPAQQARNHRSFIADYFLARGYAVVMPMMRSYAGSTGRQVLRGCNQEQVGMANALDIDAVIAYMAKQSYVDAGHVVVGGGSFGGWNTLAYGVLNRTNVKGLINYSGGALISACADNAASMAQGVEHYGRASLAPSIWIYGENDSLFSTPIWQTLFNRYVAAGGVAEMVNLGKFTKDTHNLQALPEALPLWGPRVDAFLEKIGMPSRVVYPAYLPTPFPPPSHYAAIDDLKALPYVNENMRALYAKFLDLPVPRVFLLSSGGWSRAVAGGFDPLVRGSQLCREAHQQCQIYAVDYDVTWIKPTGSQLAPPVMAEAAAQAVSALPASSDAALADLDAIPYLSGIGKQAYRQFLAVRGARAFALSPDGGFGFATGGNAPAEAIAFCGLQHKECRLYVIDHTIVWKR